jgi:hypothetical protein
VKRPRKPSTDRARRFCSALATETRDRPNWWVSIQTVADRLGMPGDDAIKLADDCARDGLVMHDQSQFTKAGRRGEVQPHSVTLNEAGRELATGKKR